MEIVKKSTWRTRLNNISLKTLKLKNWVISSAILNVEHRIPVLSWVPFHRRNRKKAGEIIYSRFCIEKEARIGKTIISIDSGVKLAKSENEPFNSNFNCILLMFPMIDCIINDWKSTQKHIILFMDNIITISCSKEISFCLMLCKGTEQFSRKCFTDDA